MMRFVRTSLAVVLMLSLTVGAMAQATSPAATQPAAVAAPTKPVLSFVPADALGFVLVKDISRTTGDLDAFLEDVHAKQMMGGASAPGTLDMLKGMTMLGHGFNPAGSFAAVMLDPKPFGFDPMAAMDAAEDEEATTKPAQGKPPFVLIVPGSGVSEVFGAYEITDAGNYKKVQLRMGEMFAAAKDGYVFLSPVEKALDALIGSTPVTTAQMAIPKATAELMEKSDFAFHINVKSAAPYYLQFMEKGFAQADAMHEGLGDAMLAYYREILPQIEGVSIVGRFAKTGIVFDDVVTAVPGSEMAKAIAAVETKEPKALLASVPNFNYVLAFGGASASTPGMTDMVLRTVDQVFKMPEMAKITPETQAKIKSVIAGLQEQVDGCAMVFGQPATAAASARAAVATTMPTTGTAGQGQVAAALVIKCKDSAKMMSLLADTTDVVQSLITAFGDEEAASLKVSYNKDAVTEGGPKADAIAISHPDFAEEDAKQSMMTMLGEDQVRILVAPVDANTVAVTFGGSTAVLGQTIQTAKTGSGDIGAQPELKEPLSFMPAKLQAIFVLNIKNGFEMLKNISRAMGEEAEVPFAVTAATPITVGVSSVDNGVHEIIYVPNELIRNGVDIYMQMSGMMGNGSNSAPRRGPAGPPVEDF